MDSAIYTALSRQIGLQREMETVANNVANASTTGFRREEVIFSEVLKRAGNGQDSISMVRPGAHWIAPDQAVLEPTGGMLDFALEGPGYFQVLKNGAPHLTRAGHFMTDAAGQLVTADGLPVLDAGGAPIAIPPAARAISLSPDGTLSADGAPVAQLQAVLPTGVDDLSRVGGTLFAATGELAPAEGARFHQGVLEGSNVQAVTELARLIEVQRRYEQTQGFLDREDQRIKSVIEMTGR